MRKEWLNKKYRHLYRYDCLRCGKTRKTLSHERAEITRICTHCEDKPEDPNQAKLPI